MEPSDVVVASAEGESRAVPSVRPGGDAHASGLLGPVVWRIARWLLRSEASAFVVDVFTRRILGWRVTISRHAHLVIDAIHQADQMRRLAGTGARPVTHHSDESG